MSTLFSVKRIVRNMEVAPLLAVISLGMPVAAFADIEIEYDLYRTLEGTTSAPLTLIELDLQPIDSNGTPSDPTDDLLGDGIADTMVHFKGNPGSVFDVAHDNTVVYQAISHNTDADTIIKRIVDTATPSIVQIELVALSLKSVDPVTLIVDEGLPGETNISVDIMLIGGQIAQLGGARGSLSITGTTSGTFVIPDATPANPSADIGLPVDVQLKITEVNDPTSVREGNLFGQNLITQSAANWGSVEPPRDPRVIPVLANPISGLPTTGFFPATTAGKLESITFVHQDLFAGNYTQTVIPATTVGSSVLTCFYECKPEQPGDFPGTNPALQETTTLLINNQNVPDATHSNSHTAHVVFFDGNENPLARADVNLSGHDIAEFNVCATIDAANGSAREPSAGLIKIAIEDLSLYQTQPTGAPYPAGLGLNATMKSNLGSFSPGNPDPFDLTNSLLATDKAGCNSTSADILEADFYETPEIQAAPSVTPQLLNGT